MNSLSDKGVLCADTKMRDLCARILAQRELQVKTRLGSGDCDAASNKIEVMAMKVSNDLECPVAALHGVVRMFAAARVVCVAATLTIHRLIHTKRGYCGFRMRLGSGK